jgi:Uma2 family endonuclease
LSGSSLGGIDDEDETEQAENRPMSTLTGTPTGSSIETPELYRWTVEQYEQMAELGILDDPRIELIDGLLVRKMTKKPQHNWTRDAVGDALSRVIGAGWYVRYELPVRIPEFDEPEPDVAVARGHRDDYRERNPGPEDVALIVEVAESSLRRDHNEKLRAYARGGIPEYWIVNLVDRVVERYSKPRPDAGTYESREVHGPEEALPVVILRTEVGRIQVAEILP